MNCNQHQDRSKLLTGDDLEKPLERKFEAQFNGFGKESEFLDEYFYGGDDSSIALPKENRRENFPARRSSKKIEPQRYRYL
jgi:hypothetical protein